ncbi:MAG: ABC transporter permease [Planctomycetota bacterium]|jgi:phospholipid/cholesterol/gamma-HCH transport system permease protein
MLSLIDHIGVRSIRGIRLALGLIEFAYSALISPFAERGSGRRIFRDVLRKQVYFTGIQALPIIFITALVFGCTLIVPIAFALNAIGMTDVAWPAVIFILVRQFSPLLLAVIVIARSGAAVATEISYMKLNQELDAMDVMGMNTDYIVVLPRLLGITTATVVLFVAFNVFAVLGGFAMAKAILLEAQFLELGIFFKTIHGLDILEGVLKAASFGLAIALVSSYQGFTLKRAMTEIPQIATRGVVQSILLCFILNLIITVGFLLARGS